jgi:hypothetical protein
MQLVPCRLPAIALSLVVIFGCAHPHYGESWPDHVLLSAGPQPGYAIKRLVEKKSPDTLVSDDGSVCRTSRARYASTREGQWIACIWSLPMLDSAHTAEPEPDNQRIAARTNPPR